MSKVKTSPTNIKEAMIKLPLSDFRCISRYPKEKKMICEINMENIKRLNSPQTLDEIINEARLDYALGDYKTFSDAKDLIADLEA